MRITPLLTLLLSATAFGQTQTWRFTCDYFHLGVTGNLVSRDRYSALYTRGLPEDLVRWSDATHAKNTDGSEKFPAPEKREFMEGFTYAHSVGRGMLKPEFFRGFPPMAAQERNLVWDTEMFETFAEKDFEHLKLNTP